MDIHRPLSRRRGLFEIVLPISLVVAACAAAGPAAADPRPAVFAPLLAQAGPLIDLNAVLQASSGGSQSSEGNASGNSSGQSSGSSPNGGNSAPSTPGTPQPKPQAPEQQQAPPPARNPYTPEAQPKTGIEIHGTIFERYRDDANHNNGGISGKGSVTFAAITGTYNFSPLYSAYLRFGMEKVTARNPGRDFNTAYYRGFEGWNGPNTIDQWGLTYHSASGTSVTLGRQDEPLDGTGTMYDQSFKVGLHTFLDGVSVLQRIGDGALQGYVFSEDQWHKSATRNSIYALRGVIELAPGAILGGAYGRFQASAQTHATGILNTANYEADATYNIAKSSYKAEYGQSNAHSRHSLYFFGAKYGYTPRDDINVYTYHIDDNADMGHDSGYPNGYRGTRYLHEHFFASGFEIIVYYETDRRIYGHGLSDSFQSTLQWTF